MRYKMQQLTDGTVVDARTQQTCNSDIIIDAKYSILMESAKCWIFPDPVTIKKDC